MHETGFATLTSSGSFTVPEGVTELWISGCAGGAGGANVNGAHTGAKGGNGAPGVLFIEW
ncbi:hypothetical protein NIN87_004472 [Escherichia coli]|nr:hypothetical protein [Escherichia coli]